MYVKHIFSCRCNYNSYNIFTPVCRNYPLCVNNLHKQCASKTVDIVKRGSDSDTILLTTPFMSEALLIIITKWNTHKIIE